MRAACTAEELEAARDYLTGNFPLNLDSTSKLTGFLAQIEYFDLGDDYIETYGDRIRGVTAKDVGDAAQKISSSRRAGPDRRGARGRFGEPGTRNGALTVSSNGARQPRTLTK